METSSADVASPPKSADALSSEAKISTAGSSSSDITSHSSHNHAEEVHLCRVCHGESELNNQLFHPCRCDGSIKYVHQECLVQWLKVSRKATPRCELCGELFHFQNIYAVDAPNALTVIDIFMELLPRLVSCTKIVFKIISYIFFWGICLPIFTSWWVRICWCLVSENNPGVCLHFTWAVSGDSLESWTSSWYSGVVAICIIIAVSVLCFELAQVVYKELEIAEKNHRLRLLQRQLAANLEVLQRFEEDNRKQERSLFAMADYESTRSEWDYAKLHCNDSLQQPPAALASDADAATSAAALGPQVMLRRAANEFLIDRKFAPRIVQKLAAACEIDDRPELKLMLSCFQNLSEVLESNPELQELIMKQCMANTDEPQQQQLNAVLIDEAAVHSIEGDEGGARDSITSVSVDADADADDPLDAGAFASLQSQLESFRYQNAMAASTDAVAQRMKADIDAGSEAVQAEDIECLGRMLMARYREKHEPPQRRHPQAPPTVAATATTAAADALTGAAMASTAGEEYDLDASLNALDEVLLQSSDGNAENVHAEQATAALEASSGEVELASVAAADDGSGVAACEVTTSSDSSAASEGAAVFNVWFDDAAAGHAASDAVASEPSPFSSHSEHSHEEWVPQLHGTMSEPEETGVRLNQESEIQRQTVSNSPSTGRLILPLALSAESGLPVHGEVELDVQQQQQQQREEAQAVEEPVVRPVNRPFIMRDRVEDDLMQAQNPILAQQQLIIDDRIRDNEAQVADDAADNAARVIAPRVVNERGQLQLGFSHLAVCGSYVALFIIFVIVVPACLGRLIIFMTLSPKATEEACRALVLTLLDHDTNIVVLLKFFDYLDVLPAVDNNFVLDDKLLVADVLYGKFNALFEISVGYSVYILLAIIGYVVYCFKYASSFDYGYSIVEVWSNQCRIIYHGMNTSVKAALLLVLYGAVIPSMMATLASRALTEALPRRATHSEFDTMFILCMVVLFFISHMVMGHVQYCAFELRQLIRRDLLPDILPENNVWDHDPDHNNMFNIQERLMRLSYSTLLKKFLINFCMFLPGAMVFLVVPLRFGHVFCLSAEKLRFRINHVIMDVQIPVEMVLSHVLIPLLIEKLHYRFVVRKGLTLFLSNVAIPLGLDWVLNEEAFPELQQLRQLQQQQQQQLQQRQQLPEQQEQDLPQNNAEQPDDESDAAESADGAEENQSLSANGMMAGEGMPVHTYGSSEEMHNLIEADPLLATESKFSEQPEEAALESARGGAKTEADDDDAENSKLSAAAAAASNSAHHSEAVQSMQQEATAATTGTAGADLNRVPSLFAQIEAPFKICYAVWLFLLLNAVLASWLLHLPLLTGRAALAAVKLPSNNDIFNFPTGLALLWGCLYVVRFVIQDVMHNWNTPALLRALCKWTTIAAKVLAVGLLWLLVPPMLLGLLLESLCLIPLRTPLMETPQFPLLQCWAVGLILLKVWIRCVLSGVFGDIEMRNHLEHIIIRGFAQFDATHTLKMVVLPTILALMDFVAVPFFAARLCTMFLPSYMWRTLVVRFSYHTYIALRLCAHLATRLVEYLVRLHNEIRDSRYLIGTRLTNRS